MNLAVTESQVVYDTAGEIEDGIAAEAIPVGDVVYKDTTLGQFHLAQATTAVKAAACGIAISASEAANQGISVQKSGTITLGAGAGPTVGETYAVSATAGKIAPEGDLVITNYVTTLGIGDQLRPEKLSINNMCGAPPRMTIASPMWIVYARMLPLRVL